MQNVYGWYTIDLMGVLFVPARLECCLAVYTRQNAENTHAAMNFNYKWYFRQYASNWDVFLKAHCYWIWLRLSFRLLANISGNWIFCKLWVSNGGLYVHLICYLILFCYHLLPKITKKCVLSCSWPNQFPLELIYFGQTVSSLIIGKVLSWKFSFNTYRKRNLLAVAIFQRPLDKLQRSRYNDESLHKFGHSL